MAKIEFNQDHAATLVRLFQNCEDSLQTFVKKGAEEIRNCSVKGPQEKKIIEAADEIEEKSKFAVQGLSEIREVISVIIKNVMGFDESTIMNKVKEEASNAKAGEPISVNKASF